MKKNFILLFLSFFVVKGFVISAEEKINNKNSIYVRRNVIKVHNVKYNISNNEWDFSEIETVGKDENKIMDLKSLLLQE